MTGSEQSDLDLTSHPELEIEEVEERMTRFSRERKLSRSAWDAFDELLDRPAKPVSGLADLLKRGSVSSD